MRKRSVISHLLAVLVLAISFFQLASAGEAAWNAYGGNGGGGGQYSPLSQITVDNVEDLQVAWTYRTGEVSDGTAGIAPTTPGSGPR